MKTLRVIIVRLLLRFTSLFVPKGTQVLILTEQSLRAVYDAHELKDRLQSLENRRANWDHAFDYLTSLSTRMTSFERTSQRAMDAAQYVRDFRHRLEALGSGPTLNRPQVQAQPAPAFTKAATTETVSPTREVNSDSEVAALRKLTT